MYHRIDGRLVAIGVLDILHTFVNSGYFIQDPDYMFLHMGVVGAIRELEFMRMIKKKYNPDLTYYLLGELVPKCSKVNYKLNYQPGEVLCPRTKNPIPYAEAKELMAVFT
jgi:arginyl-tRNA---protein transferase